MRRRDFIGTLPAMLAASRTVHSDAALPTLWDGWKDGGSLVLLEMRGGCDGLNLLVPYRDGEYFRRRPRIAITPGQVLRVSDTLGFPAVMPALCDLYSRGFVAVIRGVGTSSPFGSHFAAYGYWNELLCSLGLPGTGVPACSSGEELHHRALQVARSAGTIENGFFRLALRGFDTHAGQGGLSGPLAERLRDISNVVAILSGQLIRDRRFQDTLILVTTEFGRGIDENSWAGTDHGNEVPWLLIGGRVLAGIHGTNPILEHRLGEPLSTGRPTAPAEVLGDLLAFGPTPKQRRVG